MRRTIQDLFMIVFWCTITATVFAMICDHFGISRKEQITTPSVFTPVHAWEKKVKLIENDVVDEPADVIDEPAVESIIEVDERDVELLAIIIYAEAGADYIADETRYMVGDVVLNRVADSRYPDSIEEVLTQKSQYGRFYWTGVVWPDRASKSSEAHAVERAREIARDLLSGNHSELYGNGYVYQAEFRQGKDNIDSDGIIFGR